jgi:hypothetical protein
MLECEEITMAGTRREIWRDRVSGKLWAVEVQRGRVVGCCGPLAPGSLAEPGALYDLTFERDRSVLRALSVRRDEFVRETGSGEPDP